MRQLDAKLADELERVIAGGTEARGGIAAQYELGDDGPCRPAAAVDQPLGYLALAFFTKSFEYTAATSSLAWAISTSTLARARKAVSGPWSGAGGRKGALGSQEGVDVDAVAEQKSTRASFNQLVGAQQDAPGYRETERFRRLHVDDELELRGLLDRQLGGDGTLQQAVGDLARSPVQVDQVGPVRDKATGLRVATYEAVAGWPVSDTLLPPKPGCRL